MKQKLLKSVLVASMALTVAISAIPKTPVMAWTQESPPGYDTPVSTTIDIYYIDNSGNLQKETKTETMAMSSYGTYANSLGAIDGASGTNHYNYVSIPGEHTHFALVYGSPLDDTDYVVPVIAKSVVDGGQNHPIDEWYYAPATLMGDPPQYTKMFFVKNGTNLSTLGLPSTDDNDVAITWGWNAFGVEQLSGYTEFAVVENYAPYISGLSETYRNGIYGSYSLYMSMYIYCRTDESTGNTENEGGGSGSGNGNGSGSGSEGTGSGNGTDSGENSGSSSGNAGTGNSSNTGSGNTGSDSNNSGSSTSNSDSNNSGSSTSNSDSNNGGGSSNTTQSVTPGETTTQVSEAESVKKTVAADGTVKQVRTIISSVAGASVAGDISILPTGAKFSASAPLDKNSDGYKAAASAISAAKIKADTFSVINFNITDAAGTAIHQLDGYVQVSIPVTTIFGRALGNGKTVTVYRLEDNNTLTKCDTTVANGVVTFSTNHFSSYIFVESNVTNAPATGENGHFTFLLTIVGLVTVLCAYMLFMKEKIK